MRPAPKLIISLLLLLTTFLSAATPILAQQPQVLTGAELSKAWSANEQAGFSLNSLFFGLICQLTGIPAIPKKRCPAYDISGTLGAYNMVPGAGAIGSLTGAMVAMYAHPPTSTAQYLADLGGNFGLIEPAYAQVQGSGEGIIRPIKQLWQVTRNFAYLLFIVIFIAVGFMIMFRQKLDAQHVIQIQNALPGLIIGLILVTFSYFISALLVDLSFIGMRLIAQIFIQTGLGNAFDTGSGAGIQNLANNSNIFNLFTTSTRPLQNIGEVVSGTQDLLNSVAGTPTPLTILISGVIGGIIGWLVLGGPWGFALGAGAIAGGGTSLIIGLIVPLTLVVALLVQFFRLLLQLITAYITILVSTIVAPFIILYASLPGKGGSLSLWWKTILAHSITFPAVFGAFLFAGLILATAPGDWNASPPLFGGLSTELLRLIIAYGIILGTPAIPNMIRTALGVRDIQGIPQEAQAGWARGNQGRALFQNIAVGTTNLAYSRGRFNAPINALNQATWLPLWIRHRIPNVAPAQNNIPPAP